MKKKLIWAAVVVIAGALIVVAFSRVSVRSKIDRMVAAAETAGQPMSLLSLQETYRSSAEAEAAGADLFAALEAFRSLTTSPPDHPAVVRWEKLDSLPFLNGSGFSDLAVTQAATNLLELQQVLNEFDRYLDPIRQLVRTNQARYAFPIAITNGFDTLLPHVSQLVQVAEWTQLRAFVSFETGDIEEGIESVADAYRLSATLKDEPLVISQLIRIRLVEMANRSSRWLFTQARFRDAASYLDLEKLRDAIDAAMPWRATHTGLLGERAMYFDYGWHQRTDIFLFVSNWSSPAHLNRFQAFAWRTANALYRMSGVADQDILFYLRSMEPAITQSTNLSPVGLKFFDDWSTKLLNREGDFSPFYLLSAHGLPMRIIFLLQQLEALERCLAADAALAVELFRLEHDGTFPVTLDELVPEYLTAVPQGLTTNGVFTFARHPGRYSIMLGDQNLFTVTTDAEQVVETNP